jgi:O-antigen ligase
MWANLLTLVSFSLMVIHAGPGEREINTGLYQILRLVEYSAVFFCFSRLAASQRAIALMLRVIAGVWAFIAAVALANFFGWLPSVRLASHLLHDAGSAGPWTKYAFVSRDVVLGPLGYNQMYIANQMTLLGVLLAFGKRRTALVRSVILFLTFIIVFLSGSRAGLVAFLCALVMALVAARWRVLLLLGMAGALLLILSAAPPRWVDLAEPAIERQGALARLEEAGSYSGRVEIWEEKLSYLRQDPSVLLFGVGWGGIGTTGDNAHMLPLQVLMETGLFGLLFFLFLFRALLRALARSGVMGQGIAVATLGLFVASLTQETFYPVPATGSFLGLYLALCGLSAARKDDETVRSGGSA